MQVVYQSLGRSPPARPIPTSGEKHINTAQNMLYIPWMVILGDHGIKKNVLKTSIVELPKVKKCICRLCTNPLGDPPPLPCAQYPHQVKNT